MQEIKNLCNARLHYLALMSGAPTAMLKFEKLWKIYNTTVGAAMHPVEGFWRSELPTDSTVLPESSEHVLAMCLDMCMEHWKMLRTCCPRLILVAW